jgi:hypothetical protein
MIRRIDLARKNDKKKVFGALTNRWWSAKGGRAWKAFYSSSVHRFTQEVKKKKKNQKKKFKFLPTFGTLKNPQLWS